MGKGTDDQLKNDDQLTGDETDQGPISLEEMLEAISCNGDSEAQDNLSPQSTSIVIEMQLTYQNRKMCKDYLEYAMGLIPRAEQLAALKALRSLIGEGSLRKIVSPTPQDLDNDLDALSPVITNETLGVEGVAAYQSIVLLRLRGQLTGEALVAALKTVPTLEQKRAIVANLADRLPTAEYRDLIGR